MAIRKMSLLSTACVAAAVIALTGCSSPELDVVVSATASPTASAAESSPPGEGGSTAALHPNREQALAAPDGCPEGEAIASLPAREGYYETDGMVIQTELVYGIKAIRAYMNSAATEVVDFIVYQGLAVYTDGYEVVDFHNAWWPYGPGELEELKITFCDAG